MHEIARDLVSGTVAGVTTIVIMTPIDTARTRLQASLMTNGNHPAGGGFATLRSIYSTEGVRGLYKGMAAPVLAQAVYKTVLFGAFGISSRFMQRWELEPFYFPAGFASGAFAGTVNSLFVTPVEFVRNNLAVQKGFVQLKYAGPYSLVKAVVQEAGIAGLFRGLCITVVRDFFGVGFYFATFHSVRHFLEIRQDSISLPRSLVVPVSGMCAGVAYWTTALPFDAMKTAIQTSPRKMSIRESFNSFRTRPKLLYKGLFMAICRGIPGSAITFTVQNRVSNRIDEYFREQKKI